MGIISVCNPILALTSPEWLSTTEPWPHIPSAMRTSLSAYVLMFVVCLRAHVQFCQFDKADPTADVQ